METRAGRILATLVLTALTATALRAQYFGQNRVQYDSFNFKILHTPHFDIYYYPEEAQTIPLVARMAERWYARHSAFLSDSLNGRQPLLVYASSPQFFETNVVPGLGQGVGGVTEPAMRRIVLPFAGSLEETDHVIGHELVHAFQYDITGHGRSGSEQMASAEQLPLWFIEGMAEYLSLGPQDPNTAMWMRDATQKELPSLHDLESSRFFPYRFGQSFLAYIGGKYGDRTIGTLLRVAALRHDVGAAIDSVLRVKPDTLVAEWHRALHAQYDTLRAVTKSPSFYGTPLITSTREGGELNVSPVLSPDGNSVVFFSTRDQFAVDLFLADARTGKVLRKIYSMETNPHFEGLQFINSAGSWNPSGNRFVFAAVRKGKPVLSILNVPDGSSDREIPLPGLDEVFDPAWSPDGKTIAFSALHEGVTDLFEYVLGDSTLHQLTDDPYADLQPAWSPDGKTIAFVTDRFGASLARLKMGNYQLALMDHAKHTISHLATLPGGKSISPQWSPDGRQIYFLSDYNGATNIFRVDRESGSVKEVTDLFTGVSGITGLSPALSVARGTDRLAFSAYEKGEYGIYAIDSLADHPGTLPVASRTTGNPALLPPSARNGQIVQASLGHPEQGLPPDMTYMSTDYTTSFRLAGVIQPTVSAGYSRFGSYLGGGVSLIWSDMLNNQTLITGIAADSYLGSFNLSGQLGYINAENRINWGAFAQQIPYANVGYAAGYDTTGGQLTYVEQQLVYRQVDRGVSAMFAYPFSEVTRVEGSVGFRNIAFKYDLITQAYDVNTGGLVQNRTDHLPAPPSLSLGSVAGALVYDNSVMGATDPVLGSRGRLELAPNFGSLNWFDLLADYRLYVMPFRPLTLAGRVLHVGRYGVDAEDPRMAEYYLGYPGLVRGYDPSSFSTAGIVANTNGSASVYSRMFGSRLLVGNVEARAPLFGLLGLGKGYYGWFPIEFVLFGDAGTAWFSSSAPWFAGGSVKPIYSTGAALRANLFGLAAEVDLAKPLSIPGKNWQWGFAITQGI